MSNSKKNIVCRVASERDENSYDKVRHFKLRCNTWKTSLSLSLITIFILNLIVNLMKIIYGGLQTTLDKVGNYYG